MVKKAVVVALGVAVLVVAGATLALAATPAVSGPGAAVKPAGDAPGVQVAVCVWKTICRPCRRVCRRVRVCRPLRCRAQCRTRIRIIRGRRRACIVKRAGWRCVMLRTRPPRCGTRSRRIRVCKPCPYGICRFPVTVCRCLGRPVCLWRTKCARICPKPRCRRVKVCR